MNGMNMSNHTGGRIALTDENSFLFTTGAMDNFTKPKISIDVGVLLKITIMETWKK